MTCLVSEASAQPLLSAPGKGDGFTMVCCGEYQVRKFWGDSVRRAGGRGTVRSLGPPLE